MIELRTDSQTGELAGMECAQIIDQLNGANLIILPTDTVYGIGANPYSEAAVNRLLAAKGRAEKMPPPLLVANLEQLGALTDTADPALRALAAAFWPGALTVIVPTAAKLGWDTAKMNHTIAVRIPAFAPTLALLEKYGPLAVSSANLHGQPPALNAASARASIGHRCAGIIDAGHSPGEIASTIIDLDSGKILRDGAIDSELVYATWAEAK